MNKNKEYIVRIQKEEPIECINYTLTLATFNNECEWYEFIIKLLQDGYKFSYRITDEDYNIYVVY